MRIAAAKGLRGGWLWAARGARALAVAALILAVASATEGFWPATAMGVPYAWRVEAELRAARALTG